jgi:hypothetical protein
MTASYIPALLQLRLIVGYLGERAQCAWWPTAFYESSSKLFLEPVFTKTSRLAQYHGVVEAARRLHDEHLSVGSYHLFRLPEEVEQGLYTFMQSSAGESSTHPQSKDDALQMLTQLAAAKATTSVGPIAVGHIRDIDAPDTLKTIASAYLSAFSNNARSYPYMSV